MQHETLKINSRLVFQITCHMYSIYRERMHALAKKYYLPKMLKIFLLALVHVRAGTILQTQAWGTLPSPSSAMSPTNCPCIISRNCKTGTLCYELFVRPKRARARQLYRALPRSQKRQYRRDRRLEKAIAKVTGARQVGQIFAQPVAVPAGPSRVINQETPVTSVFLGTANLSPIPLGLESDGATALNVENTPDETFTRTLEEPDSGLPEDESVLAEDSDGNEARRPQGVDETQSVT